MWPIHALWFRFQSTSPREERPLLTGYNVLYRCFNPRLPRGERLTCLSYFFSGTCFNPRPPRRERLNPTAKIIPPPLFQSTSPAKGTTGTDYLPCICIDISIHVPREGNDQRLRSVLCLLRISIHVPREGNDGDGKDCRDYGRDFNPRPPRRERHFNHSSNITLTNFNPRPPRRERQ